MDEIFSHAKRILVLWMDQVESENVMIFQNVLQTKTKNAQIVSENVPTLLKSRRDTSSFDLILFNLVSEKDSPTRIDLLNEFFRLLHPNGYLLIHIERAREKQAIDHFKMCGFSDCNPLDSNSSFLIECKDKDLKRTGSLWLCQKPTFDVGYSVPLRRPGVSLMRQISTTGGGKKTWTVENDDDDDDLIDTDHLLDENDRRKPDVKSYACAPSSFDVRKACKNCSCGLTQELEHEEHTAARENLKSSCGSCYLGDAFRCAGCPARGLPPYKPGERVTLPTISDV